MAEEKDIALVADFLEDRLEEGERKVVEGRLLVDQDFKLLFDDIQLFQEALGSLNRMVLLSRMDELEAGLGNPLKNKETKTVFWTFQRLAAAFIGLAIVAFASWYGLRSKEVDGAALYQEYYTAYENVMVPITRGADSLTLMERTFQAYELREYNRAAGLFDELLKTDQRAFVKFYAGVTAMEMGDEDAEKLLTEVINEKGDFAVRAQWYLALLHLKKKEYNTTILLLEALKESGTSYGPRATELLKEIR